MAVEAIIGADSSVFKYVVWIKYLSFILGFLSVSAVASTPPVNDEKQKNGCMCQFNKLMAGIDSCV